MLSKECKDCKQILPSSDFSLLGGKFLSSYCKPCHSKRARVNYLMTKYGLTADDREKMILDQCNKCGICGNDFLNSKDTHVDHCHSSGRVRKLLCTNCNTALGKFKDDKEILKKAIKYLEEN